MINQRRNFIKSSLLGAGALMLGQETLFGDIQSGIKITKISHYRDPEYLKPTFAQARDIVVVETNAGITGIGEGGSKEMIQNCAEMLIGEDPFRIEHLWQKVYRQYFYPSGRERLHAMGGLDMALWDIKGKYLKTPIYELLGGLTRNYLPCYSTGFPDQGSVEETARACIEAGFYAYRVGTVSDGRVFDSHKFLDQNYRFYEQVREGVGEKGQWCTDFHTRFDTAEAVTMARMIEPLKPLFVEDLIRSENPGVYRALRDRINVPIAVGEHFGDRWDINELIEENLIDHSRVTLPNVGGITEMKKIAALCETHYVGMIPHFTGPISTAALVHVLASSSGFVMAELTKDGPAEISYLNDDYLSFKNGKLYPNERSGLGIELKPEKIELVNVITKGSDYDHPVFERGDGSITNW
ncbi:mandelate racemase/muconate lactonizing enzyme family protein [Candidatus Pelagisphaera phototrophica]|uniref:mandelate racemase/muconate lactonizing enzyme family protein n=1 Tax=Candidatus Pelagisphaera phototrophica TaxID=2684113 RepID=UPI0019F8B90F|nr:mandelate racemase/muconate lactonizing enzyme family protein [Candidatus Pelagisphaera phototrophica]QXD32995.1 mandelate racemase/muconate lactonizing enzyme family protein [Candidatus Pelagisphaera phototrophica]